MSDIVNPLAESTGIIDPYNRILALMERGGDPDVMKKMMDMAKDWKANQAKEEFFLDMNLCQADMAPVIKDSRNPQTNSDYAKLESLNTTIKPCYTKHGFSVQFSEGTTALPEHVRIVADVLHCGGHERQYFVDLHMDGKGIKGNQNMIPIHGKASTFSYGQRYLICMIFNVTIAGQDFDGNTQPQGLTEDQTVTINELFQDCREAGCEVDLPKFYSTFGIADLNGLLQKDFPRAVELLQRKKKGAAK